MNIKVKFSSPYYGAVHVRDFRKNDCMKLGKGEENLNLNVNIFSKEGETDYCGVFISKNLEVSRCLKLSDSFDFLRKIPVKHFFLHKALALLRMCFSVPKMLC